MMEIMNNGTQEEKQPRHQLKKFKGEHLKLRNALNITFMLLAVCGVAYYFAKDNYVGSIIIMVGIAVKFCETIIRMLKF